MNEQMGNSFSLLSDVGRVQSCRWSICQKRKSKNYWIGLWCVMQSNRHFVRLVKYAREMISPLQSNQHEHLRQPKKVGYRIFNVYQLNRYTFTFSLGVLLSMPGFIGNYKLSMLDQSKSFNSLGCKLVTSFSNNEKLNPKKPNILANVFLFNENTGELMAILQANEITAWRTAAASLVASKFLYSKRPSLPEINTLAILGCGVQVKLRIEPCWLFNERNLILCRVEFMALAFAPQVMLHLFACGIETKAELKH